MSHCLICNINLLGMVKNLDATMYLGFFPSPTGLYCKSNNSKKNVIPIIKIGCIVKCVVCIYNAL